MGECKPLLQGTGHGGGYGDAGLRSEQRVNYRYQWLPSCQVCIEAASNRAESGGGCHTRSVGPISCVPAWLSINKSIITLTYTLKYYFKVLAHQNSNLRVLLLCR